jgi:acyl-coenzyme A synthetase/AMP-(fatty) acid ligase
MDFDVTNLHGRRATGRWNRMAVGDLLERVTWSFPDKEAIVGWEGAYGSPEYARVSYRVADETANRVANALIAAGLERGDRVLLFCDNSVEAMLMMIGIAKAGLVAAPVNPMMAPDVVARAIEHVQARFVVVDAVLSVEGRACIRLGGPAPSGHDPDRRWGRSEQRQVLGMDRRAPVLGA